MIHLEEFEVDYRDSEVVELHHLVVGGTMTDFSITVTKDELIELLYGFQLNDPDRD